ncbi:MAG: DUF4870 domain-containing protein [Cyanobacteriota bacterium]|nr:DUF4870 domain-containing protein [Cyanobacteriota bacterium]
MNDTQQRQILSAIAHGAIFLSSTLVAIAIPIALLVVSEDEIIKANARESLNFHINLYIYALLCAPLIFVFIGIPLLVLLGIASFILPIFAILKVLGDPGHAYRYPFIFRLI